MKLELAELMALRSNFYALLSCIYRDRANAEFLAQLARNRELIAALEDLAGRRIFVDEDVLDVATVQDLAEIESCLAHCYAKLFLGEVDEAVSPCASAYLRRGGAAMQEPMEEIKRAYWEEGLELTRDWQSAADHVSTMLEFMQLLSLRTGKAIEDQLWQNALTSLRKQKDFLERYVLSWVPTFCGEVFRRSQSPFYRSFALITEEFIEFDADLILRSIRELNAERVL